MHFNEKKNTFLQLLQMLHNNINMKTIIFMRHGKSSWKYDLPDIDRPLKRRGIRDAKVVSQVFEKQDFTPDVIVSSPANRALSTCKIVVNEIFKDKDIEVVKQIYDFGGYSVLDYIKSLDDSISSIMLFGHNHAFTSLANDLGDTYIGNVPTAGLVMLTFNENSWKNIKAGTTKLTIFPRDYKNK